MIASIPSPSSSGLEVGPFDIHMYGLMYAFAVTAAVLIVRRRWSKLGGDPELPFQVAIWAFPAGLLGGRLYFDITSFNEMPHTWWGPFAVWDGGLGIWGGIAAGAAVGIWRVHRAGVSVPAFMDCTAPALLVAQAIGRVGNYFNQELFGGPTNLPWGLEISPAHRPAGYLHYATFQPTFLYEIIWNLGLAGFLVWLGHHRRSAPPASSPSTSPATRPSVSSRRASASTPPTTSSASASTSGSPSPSPSPAPPGSLRTQRNRPGADDPPVVESPPDRAVSVTPS